MTLLSTGAKVCQTVNSTRFIEQGGLTYSVDEGADVPEAMMPFSEHAQEGLRKCKDIELAITSLEKQGASGTYFPIVAGLDPRRKRRHHHHTPSSPSPSPSPSSANGSSSRQRGVASKSCPKESSSPSLSNFCQTSPSVLQFPNAAKV